MKLPSSLSQIESDPLRKSAARHDYSRVYGESTVGVKAKRCTVVRKNSIQQCSRRYNALLQPFTGLLMAAAPTLAECRLLLLGQSS
jgi:hypothetical protein